MAAVCIGNHIYPHTMINVNLPKILKFYYCQEVYIGQYKPSEIFFFSILQWQWHSHGEVGLEKTHQILRGLAIPPNVLR